MLYKTFYCKYITGVCRDCLNKNAKISLASQDCSHNRHGAYCPQCGDFRYAVVGLKRSGWLKVLFYREKRGD